jgi:pSer/pThr/pTyr-binding forkhead associated (FHA) protein
MPRLVLKFGESVLKSVSLEKSVMTIGRKMDNDVVIDNLAVSGHHAKVTQEGGSFFVEDTASTNGTFLNDVRVEKRRLQHGDRIRVGKHVLVFEETAGVGAPPAPVTPARDPDKTVLATPEMQRELQSVRMSAGADAPLPGGKIGVVLVVSGQTDKNEYKLTDRVSVIGSQDTATVKLTGWFAPKVAALISRTETGYALSASEDAKKVQVNGAPIQGRGDLKDGDLIEVAGVKMYFYLRLLTT